MAHSDEISSTEKLLDVIRGENSPEVNSAPGPLISERPDRAKKSKGLVPAGSKIQTTGIEIGYSEIRVAKTDRKGQLADYASFRFDPEIDRNSPEFSVILKKVLKRFAGKQEGKALWTVIDAQNSEIKRLRIPKVPPKEISNTVYWTLKKEVPFEADESVIDFEILGEVIDAGFKKIEVIACLVSRRELENIKKIFSKTGYVLTGATLSSFAIQNLIRTGWVDLPEDYFCHLSIGLENSRIDIFSGQTLLLSREIRTGLNSFMETAKEALDLRSGSGEDDFTFDQPSAEFSDGVHPSFEQIRNYFLAVLDNPGAVVRLKDGREIGEDQIFNYVMSAVDRLARQLEMTVSYFNQHITPDPVTGIYISGPMSGSIRFRNQIGEVLGVPVSVLDALRSGLDTSRAVAKNFKAPSDLSESRAMPVPIGLALSHNNHTPNFLHTYADEEELSRFRKMRGIFWGVLTFCMIILGGFLAWQFVNIGVKAIKLNNLESRLNQYQPRVDQNLIGTMMDYLGKNKEKLEKYKSKYRGMAVVSEIVKITPENIKLLDVLIDLGSLSKESKPEPGRKADQEQRKMALGLKGVVTGNRQDLEPALTQYLLTLQRSPLFDNPTISEQSFRNFEGKDVLMFTAELDIQ